MGGDYRRRQIGMVSLDVAHQVDTVTVRQAHVGQAEVEAMAAEQGTCLLQILCGTAVDLHPLKGQAEQFADVRFVVDDQGKGTGHGAASVGVSSAKRIRKQLPPAGGLK